MHCLWHITRCLYSDSQIWSLNRKMFTFICYSHHFSCSKVSMATKWKCERGAAREKQAFWRAFKLLPLYIIDLLSFPIFWHGLCMMPLKVLQGNSCLQVLRLRKKEKNLSDHFLLWFAFSISHTEEKHFSKSTSINFYNAQCYFTSDSILGIFLICFLCSTNIYIMEVEGVPL